MNPNCAFAIIRWPHENVDFNTDGNINDDNDYKNNIENDNNDNDMIMLMIMIVMIKITIMMMITIMIKMANTSFIP